MIIHPRSEWVPQGYGFRTGNPPFPSWDKIQWLVGHWPGGNVRPADYDAMKRLIQSQHIGYRTDPKRGYDLGYNWVLDPWGEWWESRGFTYRNAANDGDKLKATMGNINWITMSVQIVCNLDEGANEKQKEAMREMHGVVINAKKNGIWIPWRPHWYSDSTICPGPYNSTMIENDAFNYVAPDPGMPPSGNLPPITTNIKELHMLDWNGMILAYDGFRIRRIVSGNAVIGERIPVTDLNLFDILNEPGIQPVGPNPFRGIPGYEHAYCAAAWDAAVQKFRDGG